MCEQATVGIEAQEFDISGVCHEANRAYCRSLDDESQVDWCDVPDWQMHSVVAGVRQIIEHPDTTPEQSHEGWLRHKEADGWVYGETKDPEAKTHPCMVPYGDLPKEQRLKDAIFGAIVRAMLT